MLPTPEISLDHRHALFLDFDGTLVDIAPSPDSVVVDPQLTTALAQLHERLGGALAIISGRPIHELDHWLAPLTLPAAGVHGAERRHGNGEVERLQIDALDAVAQGLQRLVDGHAGLRLERKGMAVALHYREAPELQALCEQAMAEVQAAHAALHVLHGKKVLELLPRGVSKGHAIEAFMAEPPFAARHPVFVGDDVTDEAGFAFVRQHGGSAVKVGPGETAAQQRLEGPADVRRWLFAAARSHHPDAAEGSRHDASRA